MDKKHIVPSDISILEAIDRLNSLPGDRMTIILVDEYNRAVGTLTDGDIRRALLRGVGLGDAASKAAFTDFRFLTRRKRYLQAQGITL